MRWPDLWRQFKGFALKGRISDLAIAVVIGTAFGAVVNSLVKDVIMPIFSYILPSQGEYLKWHVGRVLIGKFLGELVNFFVVAGALFLVMVKLMGTIQRVIPPLAPDEPATKECPFCLSVIPARARKCANCTADLENPPSGSAQIEANR
jgi:large conductance mechanosensitive channel